MEVKYVFGIDLGTTYSVISYLDENQLIQTCRNENGSDITPSVVDLSDVNPIVGEIAKDNNVLHSHSVLSCFKREMGNGHAVKYYGENSERKTTAIDLSAAVLEYLAKYASDATGSKVGVVVITVPAYFGTEEKKATKEAAEKAHFDSVHLIEEPTAAAVYYGYQGDKNETVLVYDLGGGTFDAVAVDINGYDYDCIAVDGDQQLGGRNWDSYLQEIFMEKLAEAGIDAGDLEDEDNAIIEEKVEKAKKALTNQTVTDVRMRLSVGRAQFEVSRQEFEEKTRPLLDRTIATTKSVKEKAEAKGKTITKILLVGGSSYMPQVQARLITEFPDVEVPNPMDPNMAVSKGAAYYGKVILAKIIEDQKKMEENSAGGDEQTESGKNTQESEFAITASEMELAKNNANFQLTGDIINISSVAVCSIGLMGVSNGRQSIKTLLKRGNKLPTTADLDIPIADEAIAGGHVDLQLFEHRLEDDFVDPEDASAQLKELHKQSGDISKDLAAGSKMHIHMTIDHEGLLKMTATDPNGVAIELEATAETKSAD